MWRLYQIRMSRYGDHRIVSVLVVILFYGATNTVRSPWACGVLHTPYVAALRTREGTDG